MNQDARRTKENLAFFLRNTCRAALHPVSHITAAQESSHPTVRQGVKACLKWPKTPAIPPPRGQVSYSHRLTGSRWHMREGRRKGRQQSTGCGWTRTMQMLFNPLGLICIASNRLMLWVWHTDLTFSYKSLFTYNPQSSGTGEPSQGCSCALKAKQNPPLIPQLKQVSLPKAEPNNNDP